MLITKITAPKRQPNRRRIFLDGIFSFSCKVNVVARFRLREGMRLSKEQLAAIQQGQVRQECFDQAMKYLKLRLHSRAELAEKLARRDYGRPLVKEVLDQLTGLGYVNDEQFAQALASSASGHKQYGRERARLELLQKGISEVIVERALDEVYNPADSAATIRALVKKHLPRLGRLDPTVARRRIIGMLLRRGFEEDMVQSIVEKLMGPEEEIERDSDGGPIRDE